MNVFCLSQGSGIIQFIVQGMNVSAGHFKRIVEALYQKKQAQTAVDAKDWLELTKGVRTLIQ